MGFFDSLKKAFGTTSAPQATGKKAPTTQAIEKEEKHQLAGTPYYQNAIKSIGVPNPDYKLNKAQLTKKRLFNVNVYEYQFQEYKAELVPEPTNQYDPNAIKVLIAGKHVGYIKKGSCSHVKKLISTNSIKSVTASIGGGNYKCISCCDPNDKETHQYESSKGNIGVKVTIKTT